LVKEEEGVEDLGEAKELAKAWAKAEEEDGKFKER